MIEGNSRTSQQDDHLELGFVLTMCTLMSVAGIGFILHYGSNVPVSDDWGFAVIPLAEGLTSTTSWIWQSDGDHRLPLQKLVMRWVWNATGGSLRGGMLCGFLPLALVAASLPFVARAVRGRSECTDAFFPLLLLHWGHAGVFLWLTTMSVPWVAGIECLLIASFANPRWYRSTAGAGLSAVCLVLLALQGGTGLTAAIPFAVGLVIIAAMLGRQKTLSQKCSAMVLAASVLVTALWFVIVALAFDRTHLADQGEGSILAMASAALEFLTMSVGQTARRMWPVSGIAMAAAIGAALSLLIWKARVSRGEDRLRAILLLLATLAPCSTALAIGVGRHLQGGLLNRYGLYSASAMCALYFISMLYGPPRLRSLPQMALFTAVCASSLYYASEGIRFGKERRENTRAFVADVTGGSPITKLVAVHDPVWVGDEQRFRRGLLALRKAGISPFDAIKDDPPLVEHDLGISPSLATAMDHSDGVWRGKGRDSRLVFSFERPVHVVAIRCAYVLRSRRSSTQWETSWIRAANEEPFQMVGNQRLLVNYNSAKLRGEEVQYAWIDEPIHAFAISPSAEPCEFEITKLTVLLRPGDSPPYVDLRASATSGAARGARPQPVSR
jgi:hypothetical protein